MYRFFFSSLRLAFIAACDDSSSDLKIPTSLLEADSAAGQVDVAVEALNQGAPASATPPKTSR